MYKLLVVDDEMWIRQRIAETIPWKEINITQVETAMDGQEALEKVDSFEPDIMIMDIRMPVLDGIELMHILQERESFPKVIVLSGYDDFNYAKEALKFGAFDYILKPVEDESLFEVVKECCMIIALDREKKKEISRLRTTVELGYEAVKERALCRIISGEYPEGTDIRQKNTPYSIDTLFSDHIKADKHLCLLIHIDCDGCQEKDRNLVWFIIKNVMTEILNAYGACSTALLAESNETLFVLSIIEGAANEDIRKKLYKDVEMIRKMIKERMNFTILAGMGMMCDNFWDLPYAYDTAKIMLKRHKWSISDVEEEGRLLMKSLSSGLEVSSGRKEKMVRRSINYIMDNYQKPISLNDIAEYLEINPSYFCRVFKDEMNVSFVTFLQNYRIEKAVEFMKCPEYKIYEIGNMVGYENQQYFNKVFKRAKGMSPAAFREYL